MGSVSAHFAHRVKDSPRDLSAVVLSVRNFHRLPDHSTVLFSYFCVVQITQLPPLYTENKQKTKKGKNATTVKCLMLESLKAVWERREAVIILTYGEKWVANALGFFYLYSSFCSKWPYWAVSTWWHSHTAPRCVHPGTRAGVSQYFQVTNKKWEIKSHSQGSLYT